MDLTKYMNLSIPRARYEHIVKEWGKIVQPNTESSFTVWTTDVLESMLLRYRYLSKAYPDLKLISSGNSAFVIEDTKNNTVAKVWLNDGVLDCTAQDKERFIMYACLHPLYNLR